MDFKDFFKFTQQERRGIIVFLSLTTLWWIVVQFWPKQKQFLELDVSSYYIATSKDLDTLQQKQNPLLIADEAETVKPSRFVFNPNTLGKDSFLLLGFSKFSIQNLLKYRDKGGKINNVDKFKAIFGVDTVLIDQLEMYIDYNNGHSIVEKNETMNVKTVDVKADKVFTSIDINRADSLSLLDIKGVGPYLVSRILKYRNKLGGYLYKEQLLELDVIKDSLYLLIEPSLIVDQGAIQKINLNTADYKTFAKHPYFTQETIKALIKYRQQHGPFQDIAHIRRIVSLKESTGKKILPYLRVE